MPSEPVSTISWPAILIGERSERRMRSASAASSCGRLLGEQQDRELVAADARQRVLRPEMALQAARHREQQAVADDEAERRRSRS